MSFSFASQGWNPHTLQWRQGVLTTGPPGKSQIMSFFVFLPLTTSSRLHCATDALSVSLLRCELSAELHLRLSFHWSLYSWTVGFSPLLSLSSVAWQLSSNISNLPLQSFNIIYLKVLGQAENGRIRRGGTQSGGQQQKKFKYVSISLSQYSGTETEIFTIFF